MICAIHQPNLFPWLGYFAKIAKADTFVFLDEVQFPKTSRGTWINRVKILTGGTSVWLTCPIQRTDADIISRVRMADPKKWKAKTLRTLTHSYGKTPFFHETMALLEPVFSLPETGLAGFNMAAITGISEAIGLECHFKRHSQIRGESLLTTGSERLAAICARVGATTYLAGDGAEGYEEIGKYAERGISFARNNFAHPTYAQARGETFVAGLSTLDALFNLGCAGTHRLLTD